MFKLSCVRYHIAESCTSRPNGPLNFSSIFFSHKRFLKLVEITLSCPASAWHVLAREGMLFMISPQYHFDLMAWWPLLSSALQSPKLCIIADLVAFFLLFCYYCRDNYFVYFYRTFPMIVHILVIRPIIPISSIVHIFMYRASFTISACHDILTRHIWHLKFISCIDIMPKKIRLFARWRVNLHVLGFLIFFCFCRYVISLWKCKDSVLYALAYTVRTRASTQSTQKVEINAILWDGGKDFPAVGW